MKPDFNAIRADVRTIVETNGGKIEIKEWSMPDGDMLKVTLIFKQPRVMAGSVVEPWQSLPIGGNLVKTGYRG